jgi:hypothetical protein
MHKVLRVVAALLLLVAAAVADDVVVYRGTSHLVLDTQNAAQVSPTVKVYYVVNYTTGSLAQVLYFTKLGKKMISSTSPVRITRGTLPNAKNATLIATGFADSTAADDFSFSTFLARGVDTLLTIETSPARRAIERPRSFTAKAVFVVANPGEATTFQDATTVFTVDFAKTVAANNGDKTVAAVRDEIIASLTAQGYQLTWM